MKCFFDTSVLVAAALAQHTHHLPSLTVYRRAAKHNSACAAHSLAELYATLTRLPGKQRLAAEQALLVIDDVRQRLRVVHLTEDDYYSTISAASGESIVGGAIYDALLARCALKFDCNVLYTWNVGDFTRLGHDVAKRVRTP